MAPQSGTALAFAPGCQPEGSQGILVFMGGCDCSVNSRVPTAYSPCSRQRDIRNELRGDPHRPRGLPRDACSARLAIGAVVVVPLARPSPRRDRLTRADRWNVFWMWCARLRGRLRLRQRGSRQRRRPTATNGRAPDHGSSRSLLILLSPFFRSLAPHRR